MKTTEHEPRSSRRPRIAALAVGGALLAIMAAAAATALPAIASTPPQFPSAPT